MHFSAQLNAIVQLKVLIKMHNFFPNAHNVLPGKVSYELLTLPGVLAETAGSCNGSIDCEI